MNVAAPREWILLAPDSAAVRELSTRHGLSHAASKVLVNRGIVDARDVERFLSGTLSDLPDLSLLKDVYKAARRIAAAGSRNEPVLIYADYDADGATGAACLYLFLKRVFPSLPVRIHQNDRQKDGYGLRTHVLAPAAREGFRLVVTVDCGISDVAAVREAAREGVEVIVTDHHLPGETVPEAFAIVDPMQPDCPFPGKEMAGVGVAFLLVCALRKVVREMGGFARLPEPPLRPYLDLVALGTVADMAALRGGNRLLVREGLREIRKSPRPGIEALFEASGVPYAAATETDLGFRVGPRLNAAGRVGDSTRSSRILVSESRVDAGHLARELNEDNALRQREEERIVVAVEAALAAAGEIPPAIVLSDPAWNAGVLGIVASKVLERYGRPVVLLQEEDGAVKGSCRSVEGFHIVSALSRLSHLLTRYGGHAQAAGLALSLEHLDAFRRGLEGIADRHARETPFVRRRMIDARLRVDEITPDLLSDLDRLRPFGAGNEEPLFLLPNIRVAGISRMGAGGRHLRFAVEEDGRRLSGVAFHREGIPIDAAGRSDLLFSVQENVYRGAHSLQLLLKDARAPGESVLCGGASSG
ncbi:MAG: single-stranded-DNA-specific exonuclease RecJ [Deltaproteobacteria bacterium CG2_30_66_27]|nr:MAG: single-stranded-DNA-specific exonuclease RecJ [Deltaproteobacteria bacterium CG2_30_66_27]